jgi:hypothetical protein
MDKCLHPECIREASTRGLCHQCHVNAAMLVHRGKTTWDDLEARGKVNPKKGRGRPTGKNAWFLTPRT